MGGLSAVETAFVVTLLAGLATGVGSAIAFFAKRTDFRFLSVALAFSAGVMLYVSFVEILPKGIAMAAKTISETQAAWVGVGSFFAGMAVIAVIDKLVPKKQNPHEPASPDDLSAIRLGAPVAHNQRLMRMGTLTAIAIGIHNFPEGMATFVATLDDPRVGIAIAVAIALHNIPEGISVSVPVYFATGSRKKAFAISFLSGLAEPIGALAAYAVLQQVLSPTAMGGLFAAVAGVMVFISLDELLPTAQQHGEQHQVVYGIVLGMAVMALSLLLLK
jgi:ZIP family zinc transporter